jgi:hypothetical protein
VPAQRGQQSCRPVGPVLLDRFHDSGGALGCRTVRAAPAGQVPDGHAGPAEQGDAVAQQLDRPYVAGDQQELRVDGAQCPYHRVGDGGGVVPPAVLGPALVPRLRPATRGVALDLVVRPDHLPRRAVHRAGWHRGQVGAGAVGDREDVAGVPLPPGEQRDDRGRLPVPGAVEPGTAGDRLDEQDLAAGREHRDFAGARPEAGEAPADGGKRGLVGPLRFEPGGQCAPAQIQVLLGIHGGVRRLQPQVQRGDRAGPPDQVADHARAQRALDRVHG